MQKLQATGKNKKSAAAVYNMLVLYICLHLPQLPVEGWLHLQIVSSTPLIKNIFKISSLLI